ncbi:Actin beta/gamma 1, partial [Teratosphaeria destructans]
GSIPEREPEKRLPHPRKAAGAQITQSRHGEVGSFGSCNWNEYNLNPLTRNNWRASLVPAAAVIPAPIAYIKVVAVKKLVVEPWAWLAGPPHRVYWTAVMINRDSRGHPYSIVRGEILGFIEDELLRKHLPRMFSLISERKLGDRRRSDTVGSVDVSILTPSAPYEKSKFLGSGGSMVARLKLKEIDGRAPPGPGPLWRVAGFLEGLSAQADGSLRQ